MSPERPGPGAGGVTADGSWTRKYVVWVLAVSYVLQIAIAVGGGPGSRAFTVIGPALMFVPAIAALIVLRLSGAGWRGIRWGVGRPVYLLVAALIPTLVAIAFVVAMQALDAGSSSGLGLSASGATMESGLWLLGEGDQSFARFLPNVVLSSLVVSVLAGLLAVGEEVGWRGYLQERLVSRYGLLRGVTALGLVWAAWHVPLILQGYNFPEYPLLGAFVLFPLMGVCWSFLLAWLTIRGASVWPAVLAHGSINGNLGSILGPVEPTGSRLVIDLILLVVVGVAALPAAIALRSESRVTERV